MKTNNKKAHKATPTKGVSNTNKERLLLPTVQKLCDKKMKLTTKTKRLPAEDYQNEVDYFKSIGVEWVTVSVLKNRVSRMFKNMNPPTINNESTHANESVATKYGRPNNTTLVEKVKV